MLEERGYLLLAPVRHFPLADVRSPVPLPELQEQRGCNDREASNHFGDMPSIRDDFEEEEFYYGVQLAS